MAEDEMVGWHHRLNGHEFEQTPGDTEGYGSLDCCSPWGHKEIGLNNRNPRAVAILTLTGISRDSRAGAQRLLVPGHCASGEHPLSTSSPSRKTLRRQPRTPGGAQVDGPPPLGP